MNCRKISREDIQRVMQKGVINLSKSNRRAHPYPMFALQGRTDDKEYIRVIFAQGRKRTEVVNCYNLEKEVICDCSGSVSKN